MCPSQRHNVVLHFKHHCFNLIWFHFHVPIHNNLKQIIYLT